MTTTLAPADTTFGTAERVGPLSVVELRRYRLHPGTRETLVDLFDREFVETQEAVGMRVLGQYRDLDDPNAFVWLRGFADMPSRADALGRFYGGPVWAAHRDAANATMINSDNVLLLRPARGGGVSEPDGPRTAPGGEGPTAGVLTSVVHSLPPGTADDFASFFETSVRPELEKAGAAVVATLVTEPGPNTFPRLSVREGEGLRLASPVRKRLRLRDPRRTTRAVRSLDAKRPARDRAPNLAVGGDREARADGAFALALGNRGRRWGTKSCSR